MTIYLSGNSSHRLYLLFWKIRVPPACPPHLPTLNMWTSDSGYTTPDRELSPFSWAPLDLVYCCFFILRYFDSCALCFSPILDSFFSSFSKSKSTRDDLADQRFAITSKFYSHTQLPWPPKCSLPEYTGFQYTSEVH